MLENKPRTVTITNIYQFFNTNGINPSSAKKGMLIEFNYSSPEGVHDKNPLVFIMENYNDRIIGLNLHYQFGIIAALLKEKDTELKEFIQKSNEYKKYLDELKKISKVDLKNKNLPDSIELKKESLKFDIKKIRFPQSLLETFLSDKIKASEDIFRTYLFKRMANLRKLSFKID
jgi:hypothetical protein